MMTGRFSGKVAIVTGSSNGIGRATAILLASEGARVTVTGRNFEKLEETKSVILSRGAKIEDLNLVIGDVNDATCQNELVESTLEKFGKIDILINNAGAAFPDTSGKTGIEAGIEFFDKSIQLNLRSVITMIQKCRSHLIASKGEIVNVSSIAAGPQPFIHYTFYGAAKAGLDQLTRTLALELIEHGVRVNSVSPGLINTGFLGALGMEQEAVSKMNSFYSEHHECIPMGVVGEPDDVAKLIGFLADRKSSSFIIGQSIVIDGGSSLVLGMTSHDLANVLG